MKRVETIPFAANDTYCSEEYFQRMLVLERKRTERSGKPFVLILLDVGKLLKAKPKEKKMVLQKLVSVLDSATREIDVKGWYQKDSIIGIICQDVPNDVRDVVTSRVGGRLVEKGHFSLNTNKADSIKMLHQFWPRPKDKRHSGSNLKRIPSGNQTGRLNHSQTIAAKPVGRLPDRWPF